MRSIFSRAAAQIALGLTVGVATAAVIDRLTGGGLLDGRGAVLLPALAIVMAAVGVLAALGPARRGLEIHRRRRSGTTSEGSPIAAAGPATALAVATRRP